MAGKRFFSSREVQKKNKKSSHSKFLFFYNLIIFLSSIFSTLRPSFTSIYIFQVAFGMNFIACKTISDVNLFRLWEKSVRIASELEMLLQFLISSYQFIVVPLHVHFFQKIACPRQKRETFSVYIKFFLRLQKCFSKKKT